MKLYLDINNLRHDHIAITNENALNLTINNGECVLLRGRNGVGKSTLLRLIAGILPPEHGTITIHVRISYLGAELALKESASVKDYQRFVRALGGVCETHLAHNRPIHRFSSGQKLNLRLQSVLRLDRPLWLLDEPTRFLDQISEENLWKTIEYHRANGGAVMIASHDAVPLHIPNCNIVVL